MKAMNGRATMPSQGPGNTEAAKWVLSSDREKQRGNSDTEWWQGHEATGNRVNWTSREGDHRH